VALLKDGVAPPAINLNHTPAPVDSAQAMHKRPRGGPPASTIHAHVLFDDLRMLIPTDKVWSNLLFLRLLPIYNAA
jgi:hypothetical protein